VPVAQPRYDTSSFWNGDSITGEAQIVIDLSRQRAFFYKNGILVGESPISSGRDEFPTTPGDYKILQKTINYRSGQYGDYVDATGHLIRKDVDRKVDPMPPQARFIGAPMPYFMRLYNGIGLHAGALPGYPASHGCIRMPRSMAQHFFENVQVGTPVSIIP
jgi:lipoprotein-anchoring transpeptidase ErfK/SrfK